MNAKTAKLLSRGAVCLSLVGVANTQAARRQPWTAMQRQEILDKTINVAQRNLKAKWKGTIRSERHAFRKDLQTLINRTKQSLQKGMDRGSQS